MIQIKGLSLVVYDDFDLTPDQERFVGVCIFYKTRNKCVWIFEFPIHGADIAFRNNPKLKKMQRCWEW